MIGKQIERLREQLSEHLGVPVEDAAMLYDGPSWWLFAALAGVVGVILFVGVGLGGAVGGALIGLTFASWYFFAKPHALCLTEEKAHLVAMNTPLFSSAKPHEELISHPRGAAPVEVDGRRIDYGGRRLQPAPLWRAQAEAVAAKAGGGG